MMEVKDIKTQADLLVATKGNISRTFGVNFAGIDLPIFQSALQATKEIPAEAVITGVSKKALDELGQVAETQLPDTTIALMSISVSNKVQEEYFALQSVLGYDVQTPVTLGNGSTLYQNPSDIVKGVIQLPDQPTGPSLDEKFADVPVDMSGSPVMQTPDEIDAAEKRKIGLSLRGVAWHHATGDVYLVDEDWRSDSALQKFFADKPNHIGIAVLTDQGNSLEFLYDEMVEHFPEGSVIKYDFKDELKQPIQMLAVDASIAEIQNKIQETSQALNWRVDDYPSTEYEKDGNGAKQVIEPSKGIHKS